MMLLSRRAMLASGAGLLASACDVSALKRDPKRLTLLYGQEVSTLDPSSSLALAELGASRQAYQRLLRPVVRDGAVVGVAGDLAERWEWAPDRSSVTFKLRPGNRFDDGSAVTAEAIRFSFDRVAKQKLTASQAMFWLGGITILDPYTVRFDIALYLPFIEHMLWHPGLSIVNPKIVDRAVAGDQGTAWLREASAGSGPYRVAAFAPREETVLRPNPHALVKPRWFHEVVIRTVRDTSARTMQLVNGDADIVEFLRDWQQRWLANKPGVEVVSAPSTNVLFLHVNTQRPPLDDVRVRRAISLSIDRPRMIRTIYSGQAAQLHGLLPLGLPGSDPTIPPLGYDPVAARALLAEAGVKPGHPISITALTDSGTPSTTTLAVREMVEKIGFSVQVHEVSNAAKAKLLGGDFDMCTQALTLDFPDPWIMFQFTFNSQMINASNWSRYANPALDALVARADRQEGEARAALYREAQRIVLRDLPSIPLLQMNWSYAKRTDISGGNYNFSTPQSHDFADMIRTGAA